MQQSCHRRLPAYGVLREELAQGCIDAGLPTFATRLKRFKQVSVKANRGEHLGFVSLWSAAWALHGDHGSIGLRRDCFTGGLRLGKPCVVQFSSIAVRSNTCIDSGLIITVSGKLWWQTQRTICSV